MRIRKSGDLLLKSSIRALILNINNKILPSSKLSTRVSSLNMNNKFFPISKRSQVWVETVIYTLIALTIIGLFLAFAKPKIEEIQDRSTIDQSVNMMEDINNIIISMVQGGAGNKRVVDIGINKGELKIDSVNDMLIFNIDSRHTFTEPGLDGQPGEFIDLGSVIASTQKMGRLNKVTLISNYSNVYNITYQLKEEEKILGKASVVHRLSISNEGPVN